MFVVGCLGDWRPAAAVLFEQDSLYRHPAPSRKKKQDVAGTITASAGKSRGAGIPPEMITVSGSHWDGSGVHPSLTQSNNTGGIGMSNQEIFSQRGGGLVGHRMVAFGEYIDDETASTIKARDYKDATDLICVHGTQDPDTLDNLAHTIGRNSGQENVLCYPIKDKAMRHKGGRSTRNGDGSGNGNGLGVGATHDPCPTLTADDKHSVFHDINVRRLTPIECERLQGFPDNYTNIPWRGKEFSPDGVRYKAMGNSMAVPVMAWIGKRISMFEKNK